MSGSPAEALDNDLAGLVEWLLISWPDPLVDVADRLSAIPELASDEVRSEFLRGIRIDLQTTWLQRRQSLNSTAATAAEHGGTWRLGTTVINATAGGQLQQLGEFWRLEKQHRLARLRLLGATDPAKGPDGIDAGLRADAEAISRALAAGNQPPEPTGGQSELLGTYSALLTEQREILAAVQARQRESAADRQNSHRRQLAARREAIRQADRYVNSLAFALAGLGVLSAVVIVVLLLQHLPSSTPGSGFTLAVALTSSIWGVISILLAGCGGATFTFRSANMPVLPDGEQGWRPAPHSPLWWARAFVAVLLTNLLFSLWDSGLLFFKDGNGVLGHVFGAIIPGVAAVFAAVVSVVRRPRALDAALDDNLDDVLDLAAADEIGGPGGRYATEAQRWAAFATRARIQAELQAKFWNRLALWLGLPATVLTAVGGATGLSPITQNGAGKYILASLTLVGATLTAVAASLGATARADSASTRSRSYASLGRELRTVRRLDLRGYDDTDKRKAIEDFLARFNALDGVTDQTSYYTRTHPSTPIGGSGSGTAPHNP